MVSTVTMFIVINLYIKPVTVKQSVLSKNADWYSLIKNCFNCAETEHQVSECLSNRSCVKCKGKHHWSICDKTTTTLLTTSCCSVTYHVVFIQREGIKCCALIDTKARASSSSSTLINNINKEPIQIEIRKIETLVSTNTKKKKKIFCKGLGHQLWV